MSIVTARRESAQYDGTNGAFLAAEFLDGTYTVLSEEGAPLVLRDAEGSRKTIAVGGWLVCDENRTLIWYGNAEVYATRWVVVSP